MLVLPVWVHRILSPGPAKSTTRARCDEIGTRGGMKAREKRTKQKSNQPTRQIDDATDQICKHRSHRFEGGENSGENRAENAENGGDEVLQGGY